MITIKNLKLFFFFIFIICVPAVFSSGRKSNDVGSSSNPYVSVGTSSHPHNYNPEVIDPKNFNFGHPQKVMHYYQLLTPLNPRPSTPTDCIKHVENAYQENKNPREHFIDSFLNKTVVTMSEEHPDAIMYYEHLLKEAIFRKRNQYKPLKTANTFCNRSDIKIFYSNCFDALKKIGITVTMDEEATFAYIYRNHSKNTLTMIKLFNRPDITDDETAYCKTDDPETMANKTELYLMKRQFKLITLFFEAELDAVKKADVKNLKTIEQFCHRK